MRFAAIRECLEGPPEGRHAVRQVVRLVLRNRQLDMAEHKLVVQLGRLGVVISRFCELIHDEQHYSRFSQHCVLGFSLMKSLEYLGLGGSRYRGRRDCA